MTSRFTAITLTLSLAAGGCVTTTAHRLPLTDNPLRERAIACEKACQQRGAPNGSADEYAACLDNCPGARAKDGDSCPEPPDPGVICVESTRANAGAIAGGVGATATLVLVVVILSSLVLLLTLFILAS